VEGAFRGRPRRPDQPGGADRRRARRLPGIDGVAFEEAAEAAKENCPVSKALAGVPEITLEAWLG